VAFDTFCQMEGIPGESTDDQHKDWMELLSFGHSIHQPASPTASSVGGGGSERSEHAPLYIETLVDKSTPKIAEYCSSGKPVPKVTIECCRAGGDKLKYLEIKMENVVVSDIEFNAQAQGDGGFPKVRVGLDYGKILWTYTQQKRADGTGGGNVAGGWDREANKVNA